MDRYQVWTMGIWSAQTDNFSVEHLMKHNSQKTKLKSSKECRLLIADAMQRSQRKQT